MTPRARLKLAGCCILAALVTVAWLALMAWPLYAGYRAVR